MNTCASLSHALQVQSLAAKLAADREAAIAAQRQFAATLAELQAVCPHERVAECEYQPETDYSDAKPPHRICEVCGTTEKGWGSGYKVLTNPYVRRVSRDKLFSLQPHCHVP